MASGAVLTAQADQYSLTDSSGGTASVVYTVVDVPGTYTEATLAAQLATIVAAFNSLAGKYNTLIADLKRRGLMDES